MGAVAVFSALIIVMVLVLSLVTLSKGYGYKHTIDPLPEEKDNDDYKSNIDSD